MGPINAPALAELSRLLEQPGHQLLPDAVWVSGQAQVFKHLRDVQALSLGPEMADGVLCPDCMSGAIRPEQAAFGSQIELRAYCGECGWVPLAKERARLWQASPAKVADWLNASLGLRSRYSDADDAHVHGAYFPMGAEIDPSRPLLEQVNAFGPNGYAICGSDFRSAATEAGLLPWEEIRKYWVKPHRGLLVAFDARAVHFQRPHAGPGQFAQALLNVRVERTHG